MKGEEKITYDKSKVEDYTKQLKDLWYSKAQSGNKEYFKTTDGYVMLQMGFQKKTHSDYTLKETVDPTLG